MDDFSSVNDLVERYLLYIFGGEILSEINPFPFFFFIFIYTLNWHGFLKRTINDSMYQRLFSITNFSLQRRFYYYIVAITVSLFWYSLIYGIFTVPADFKF